MVINDKRNGTVSAPTGKNTANWPSFMPVRSPPRISLLTNAHCPADHKRGGRALAPRLSSAIREVWLGATEGKNEHKEE